MIMLMRKKKKWLILWLISQERGIEMIKKDSGEIQDVKRAIRVLNKEIEIKLLQKSKLNPIRDFKKIEKIESLILKKDKQRIKLKQRLK